LNHANIVCNEERRVVVGIKRAVDQCFFHQGILW
jgi:hypothetical protein